MDCKKLFEKYKNMLNEVQRLTEENSQSSADLFLGLSTDRKYQSTYNDMNLSQGPLRLVLFVG